MKTMLGQDSWQHIVHHSDIMRVYEVQLSMNEHANHNFCFPFDSLLTVTDGQVFVESPFEESSLKANQALWLSHNQAIRCVAVTPVVRLFVVVFIGQTKRQQQRFERFASGTEHKHECSNGVTHWRVDNKDLGKVEWVMLPAHYSEPSYYVKESEQFFLPLNYDQSLYVTYDHEHMEPVAQSGLVIPQNQSHSLLNVANKPITYLSITSPYPHLSRILKLKPNPA
ncbi:hypothetical protein MAQ5080_00430 [Marinomonas aquimarina]|uniref:Uncharacterized protein n=1 Tax=Marinomonas aquimarina TaxID=295068 RepID=A0A1A8T581_9GAMM|nr:hypothetical protein [Marinomonas aquimarina]SBS26108.1 hypothetical protein MAQ5080_00430 [Marinomonas aquimarina]